MIVAVLLIVLGFAVYADRIGDQERCEAELRTEFTRHGAEPSRADYRAVCRPERRTPR